MLLDTCTNTLYSYTWIQEIKHEVHVNITITIDKKKNQQIYCSGIRIQTSYPGTRYYVHRIIYYVIVNISHRVSEAVQPDHHVFVCTTLQQRQGGAITCRAFIYVPGTCDSELVLVE